MPRPRKKPRLPTFRQNVELDAALVRASADRNPGTLMNAAKDAGMSSDDVTRRFHWLRARPTAYRRRVWERAGLNDGGTLDDPRE